jgi:hypothetical protein
MVGLALDAGVLCSLLALQLSHVLPPRSQCYVWCGDLALLSGRSAHLVRKGKTHGTQNTIEIPAGPLMFRLQSQQATHSFSKLLYGRRMGPCCASISSTSKQHILTCLSPSICLSARAVIRWNGLMAFALMHGSRDMV